jgi:hypothetical protein
MCDKVYDYLHYICNNNKVLRRVARDALDLASTVSSERVSL